MVECRHELDVVAEQHSIAEDVTAHVTDSDAGEVSPLGIDPHFAEVPAYGLPSASSRNAHGLVVITGRAAGGERVAKPESRIDRDLVGRVRERGSPLVSRNDQIRIITVVPNDIGRGYQRAVDDVVGDLKQAGNEELVTRKTLGHPAFAIPWVRQPLA